MPELTASAAMTLLETVALIALLSVAYGTVMRLARAEALGHLLVGLLFGGGAVIAMQRTVQLESGILFDLRSLPLMLAGAFLGWPGLASAAALAVACRWSLGGAGMEAGLAGIVLAAGLGRLWARWEGPGPHGGRALLRLAALSTLTLAATFLLPPPVVERVATEVWPVLLPLLWVGLLLSGAILERERRFLAHLGRLSREGEEDALTGLLNRRGFARAVAAARAPEARASGGWASAGRAGEGTGGALLLLDLDHFKRVNDRHGHAAGDAVLRALGPRLRAALRPGDVVGRMGGEEFAVFLPGAGPGVAEATGARLCEAMRAVPFDLPGGVRLTLTASVGGAWTAAGGLALEALLARADVALYEAKDAGRDCVRMPDARGDADLGWAAIRAA